MKGRPFPFTGRIRSVGFALSGIATMLRSQHNAWIHAGATVLVIMGPGDPIYEGQVVGEHSRENDIAVNVVRLKKLTNFRGAGRDDASSARPSRDMPLEASLEYIQEDELVEVTPGAIRMRKRIVTASARKRESRTAKA